MDNWTGNWPDQTEAKQDEAECSKSTTDFASANQHLTSEPVLLLQRNALITALFQYSLQQRLDDQINKKLTENVRGRERTSR